MADIPLQSLQEATGDGDAPVGRVADPVGEVAKLLEPAPAAAEQPAPETGAPPADPPSESWDFTSLAEKLGTDPEKLYHGVKVAMPDGTQVSVGELKDLYRPAAELEKARSKLIEDDTSSRREVAQARQELAALVNLLDQRQLSPEMIQEAGRQSEQARQAEASRLLQRIPEWKDPVAKAADWADIRQAARQHGYSDAEIALAEQGFADHRMVSVLRALAKAPKAASPKPPVKVGARPTTATLSPAQRHGQLKAAVKQGRLSPEAAVAQLLKGN